MSFLSSCVARIGAAIRSFSDACHEIGSVATQPGHARESGDQPLRRRWNL